MVPDYIKNILRIIASGGSITWNERRDIIVFLENEAKVQGSPETVKIAGKYPVSNEFFCTLQELSNRKHNIQAIKLIRETLNIGLLEAKNTYENQFMGAKHYNY